MIDHLIAHAVTTDPDRQFAADRPSRGVHATAMRQASAIPARYREFAACVSRRESGGSYTARNPRSSAQGRWQLLDTQWRVHGGIQYVVSRRLKEYGVPAGVRRIVRDYLHATPIYRWPGVYQDVAFAEIVDSGGWRHWSGGHGCNALVPR